LKVRLTRKILRHGAKLILRYVTFTLGKQVKRATHLPATVRLTVRGLAPGTHVLAVQVTYHEQVAAKGRGSRVRKLTLTITRTLKARVTVC
jgi:hypothetical protein